MVELIKLFLEPRVLSVLGPLGFVAVVEGFWLMKLFSYYKESQAKNDEIQEKRLEENKAMQKEYFDLTTDVNKTMDILINTLGKRSGNGGQNG